MAANPSQDSLPPTVPKEIEVIIGAPAVEMLNEDLSFDRQWAERYSTPVKKQGFLGRMLGRGRSLANQDEVPDGAFTEKTYRGVQYQTPGMSRHLTEFKPYDYLSPIVVDQMKRNGVIKTALFLKKAPILAVINKASIKHENPRVQAYLNFVMKDLMYIIAQNALFAIDYGVSLNEKVFESKRISFKYDQNGTIRTFNGESIHYKKVKWTNLRTVKEIRIQKQTQDYDGYVQSGTGAYASSAIPSASGVGEGVVINVEKSFMFGKGQENSLWGTSDLDGVYAYWYWLELISGYYMRYLEKLGTPPMTGYAPNGATFSKDAGKAVENISWLAELAGSLQDGVAVIMPSVFDPNSRNRLWELKEMALSNRGDLYGEAIIWLESAILKGVFVPDKPISSGNTSIGSYAMADVQFEAFLVGEEWDLKSLISNLNKYIIRPLIDINFGEKFADAEIVYPPLSRELKQRVFEIFNSLVQNHPDFTAIDFRTIAEELGIPLYSEEEMLKKREEAFEQASRMAEIANANKPQGEEEESEEDEESEDK